MLRGAVIGAIAAHCWTLFHRPTRIALKDKWNDCQQSWMSTVRSQAGYQLVERKRWRETKQMMRTVSDDLSFLNEQVNQLKENNLKGIRNYRRNKKDHFQSKQTD
ncbi:hypothetical protein ACEQPO_06020 [Bacillus sp. SL00103]